MQEVEWARGGIGRLTKFERRDKQYRFFLKNINFFPFISTQFTDTASINIQIQITFAKLFNVFNNTT